MNDENQRPSGPPTPPAPPTTPGGFPTAQTTWPTVIGIVGIVLGALGVFYGLYSVAGPLVGRAMSGIMGGAEFMDEILDAIEPYLWALSGLSVLSTALAVLLIVGSVRLNRRRASARGLLRQWAILKIPLSVVISGVTFAMQMEQMSVQAEAMGGAAGMEVFMVAVAAAAILFGLAWSCAGPVFVLWWFSRDKIKDEISGWPQ